MRSPQCQMDQNNLARVFGPTIVGHGMSEPPPTTIMRDTNTQPKVSSSLSRTPPEHEINNTTNSWTHEESLSVCLSVSSQVVSRLLSIPEAYWRRVLGIQTNQSYSQAGGHGAFTARLSALFDCMLLSCVRLCVSFWSWTDRSAAGDQYLFQFDIYSHYCEENQQNCIGPTEYVFMLDQRLGLTLLSELRLQVVGSNSYWSDSLWAEHKDQTGIGKSAVLITLCSDSVGLKYVHYGSKVSCFVVTPKWRQEKSLIWSVCR